MTMQNVYNMSPNDECEAISSDKYTKNVYLRKKTKSELSSNDMKLMLAIFYGKIKTS